MYHGVVFGGTISGENRSEGDQSTETTNFPCNFQEIHIFFQRTAPKLIIVFEFVRIRITFFCDTQYIIRKERETNYKIPFNNYIKQGREEGAKGS